jgi:hypothetical protein
VVAALERLGLTATDEQALAILDEVKARSLETKGLVGDEEFTQIVRRIAS